MLLEWFSGRRLGQYYKTLGLVPNTRKEGRRDREKGGREEGREGRKKLGRRREKEKIKFKTLIVIPNKN